LARSIPSEPEQREIQLKRQDFIISKIIDKKPDDNEDTENQKNRVQQDMMDANMSIVQLEEECRDAYGVFNKKKKF